MPNYKLRINNIPKVFDMYHKFALSNKFINKPISWALYQTWKWANRQEVNRNASKES